MAKRTSKERALRRKRMAKPWEAFKQSHFTQSGSDQRSQDMAAMEQQWREQGTTVWMNNRYTVHREPVPDERHGMGKDVSIVWLSIKANDDSARHDWRELQRIKNELCGEEWEAVELFPSESRLVDTCNQFHLWCMEPPARFPFGWWARTVIEENSTEFGSQRPWEPDARPSDLMSEERHAKIITALAEATRSGVDTRSMTIDELLGDEA